jgi:choline-sulfatase
MLNWLSFECSSPDALAEDGILFENSYCAAPICGPSRACNLTGHFPKKTGVYTNYMDLSEDLSVLPEQLRVAGVQTALIGKLHLWPEDKNWGFEYRRFNDSMYTTYRYEGPVSDYITWAAEKMKTSRAELIDKFNEDEACYKKNF